MPQLTRVTAGGMFELESLVMQYFGSHPAYSSETIPLTLAWHRLSQSGNSDMIAEDHHLFYECHFASELRPLGRSPSAEKHVCIVFAKDVREGHG